MALSDIRNFIARVCGVTIVYRLRVLFFEVYYVRIPRFVP